MGSTVAGSRLLRVLGALAGLLVLPGCDTPPPGPPAAPGAPGPAEDAGSGAFGSEDRPGTSPPPELGSRRPSPLRAASVVRFPVVAPPVRRLPCAFTPEALRFSPSGDRLLVSGPDLAGITVVDVASGESVVLTPDPGAGVGMTWTRDGTEVLYRTRDRERGTDRLMAVAAAGGEPPRLLAEAPSLGYPVSMPDGRVLLTWGNDLVLLGRPEGPAGPGDAATRAGEDPYAVVPLPEDGPLAGSPASLAPSGTGRHAPAAAPLPVERVAWWVAGLRVAVAGGGADPLVALVDHGRFILSIPLVEDWMPLRRVVTSGEEFFLGDASPDGRLVLVHESRGAEPGHAHVVEPLGRGRRDLGPGYGAVFAGPDVVVLEMLEHDGHRFLRSDLWAVHVATGERRPLLVTGEGIEMLPAVDPSGSRLAFVDRRDGSLHVADLAWQEVAR